MDSAIPSLHAATRRHFFSRCGMGLGSIALASLLGEGKMFGAETPKLANPLAPKTGHFPARAKNIIYLFMAGGPSQLELFDHKPLLIELNGQPFAYTSPMLMEALEWNESLK